MSDDRKIVQSRFGVKTVFEFESARLTYTLRDTSGERNFSVPYEAIAFRRRGSLTFNNNTFAWRLRLIPLATFFLGVLIRDYAPAMGAIICIISVLVFSTILIIGLFKLFAVRFILIPLIPPPPEAQGHSIRIIAGNDQALVLDALEERWRVRLRILYGRADLTRDAKQELARLEWLKDNSILSAEEFEIEASRLRKGVAALGGADSPASVILN